MTEKAPAASTGLAEKDMEDQEKYHVSLLQRTSAAHKRLKFLTDDRLDLTEDEQDELLAEFWEIVDEIEPLRATTPEGVKVKARTVRAVFQSIGQEEGGPAGSINALIRDVLGEAA